MPSTALYASCAPSDVDVNGQCAHVVWVQPPVVGFPPLTAAQGVQISGAVAACWAVGFLVRVIRKQLGV
jgi:hypothetical protein